jgi:hypothetical protein
VSEQADRSIDPTGANPLRRTIDACLFAPVGLAVGVVEELPELLTKGRRRVELQIGNALVVGRFVVAQGQQKVVRQFDEIFGSAPHTAGGHGPVRVPTPASTRAEPDADAAAVVADALADYDTLSASQVVRRLESLGPGELRAVQRYEASTRNRRTILLRAEQLLNGDSTGPTGD